MARKASTAANGSHQLSGAERADAAGHSWRDVIANATSRLDDEEQERRQNRSRQRSEDIISAAIRVFARLGVTKARISDIAAEAGIPPPSFYGYYENKEELAYAIPIRRQVQFFKEYAQQAERLATVREQLVHFLWQTADFARRDPDWACVLYLEVWPSVIIKESRVRDVLDDYARIVIGLIREGAERGEWPDDPNPYESATIFIGAISQMIITWLLYRQPQDLTRSARVMTERLIGLLDGKPSRSNDLAIAADAGAALPGRRPRRAKEPEPTAGGDT